MILGDNVEYFFQIVASLNEYEIEMTDGWYSVPCLFDGEMLKLLTQKKVTVGTKLVIMNAELTGAGEGCDPLQVLFICPIICEFLFVFKYLTLVFYSRFSPT